MENRVNIRTVYTDVVEQTGMSAGTEYTVQHSMPTDPLRIIHIAAEVFDAGTGAVIPSIAARGKVRVSIATNTSPTRSFTYAPVDVFALENLSVSELWRGWRFRSQEKVDFRFTVTTVNSLPSGNVDVRLYLMGYLEVPEVPGDLMVMI